MSNPGAITRYLKQLDRDDPGSYEDLWRLVYDRLRELARIQLYQRRPGETLNATALVHECFLKLRDSEQIEWENRGHFYGVAARAMKQVVIDYARARTRQKRGGGIPDIPMDEAITFLPAEEEAFKLLMLNDALELYGRHDARGKEVFEYVYFLNLTHVEVGELMGVATKTVQRDLRSVEAWFKENYVVA